jgi:hypothetical protein
MSVVRPALLAAVAPAAASGTSLALCGWDAGHLAILAREVRQGDAMDQLLAVSHRALAVKSQVVNAPGNARP